MPAVDHGDVVVDVMPTERRDFLRRSFFRSARLVTGLTPDRVTIDGLGAILRQSEQSSIRVCGVGQTGLSITVRRQDHRGTKSRCRAVFGFKSTVSAKSYYDDYSIVAVPPAGDVPLDWPGVDFQLR